VRDYLYLWIDRPRRCLVASGIELRDCCHALGPGRGVLLLRHSAEEVEQDTSSGLDYVGPSGLAALCEEDAYQWGDLAWVDFAGQRPGPLTKRDVAALLYAAHRAEPLGARRFRGLGNRFLAFGHDDGWYLRIHFTSWSAISALVVPLVARIASPQVAAQSMARLVDSRTALWLEHGKARSVSRTHDVDRILDARLRPRKHTSRAR
jgi:hypothetical protein